MKKIVRKKILPEYMDLIVEGKKNFEIRRDEDDIQEGDILVLEEWEAGKYKHRVVKAEVTYVLRNKQEYGLKPGYCIIGLGWKLAKIEEKEKTIEILQRNCQSTTIRRNHN